MGFSSLIFSVEATVHFDCEEDNDEIVWIADVVATPSSSHDSIPSLDSDFWDRVLSVPQAKLERLGVVNPYPKLEGPNSPDPQVLITLQSTMKLTTYLGRGGTCDAFRGTWFGVSIVAKDGDESGDSRLFAREVHAYLRLGYLCGSVVPEFFGLYRTDDFALLVLEDAGDMIYRHVPSTYRDPYSDDHRPVTVDHWADLDIQDRCAFNSHEITCLLTCQRKKKDQPFLRHVPCPHVWRQTWGHFPHKCRQRTKRNSPYRLLAF
jgi:hypothetical protein